jgi:hypothetical protein
MLKTKHSHERDTRIVFYEEGHRYEIDGEGGYTSVTTHIHGLFPTFDPDSVIASMQQSRTWNQSPYYGMTAEAIKEQWSQKGKDAATAGTQLHEDIEKWYNEEPVDNTSTEFSYFLEFSKTCSLTPYRTEWTIFDEDTRMCGSVDMTFLHEDGSLDIYDWKRVKKISKTSWNNYAFPPLDHIPNSNFWHYSLQLNLYRRILEDKYQKTIRDMVLVVLHPYNDHFQLWKVPRMNV